jgi:hypothetical protein
MQRRHNSEQSGKPESLKLAPWSPKPHGLARDSLAELFDSHPSPIVPIRPTPPTRLRQGNAAEAKNYLLAAGQTPGSPQRDSFGPNMALAKELLEKGETDAVVSYIDLCRKFWKMGSEQLNLWSAAVKEGRLPDFGPNLSC